MLNILKYDKPIEVNGTLYTSSEEALKALSGHTGDIEVRIGFTQPQTANQTPESSSEQTQPTVLCRIKVRQYMTKKSSPDFDFMKKYNNDQPMPLRVMYGSIIEETRGMYRMRLHGRAERGVCQCMKCGRPLTHPVSRYYGMGNECGKHYHIAPDYVWEAMADEDRVFAEVDAKLRDIKWEGWVIKSAIEEMTEF